MSYPLNKEDKTEVMIGRHVPIQIIGSMNY